MQGDWRIEKVRGETSSFIFQEVQKKEKKHPVCSTPSFIVLSLLLFPTLGCCVAPIHQRMCCGHDVYPLQMFPVPHQSAWRHRGEAWVWLASFSPMSRDWRYPVEVWFCVFPSSLILNLILPYLTNNLHTVKCLLTKHLCSNTFHPAVVHLWSCSHLNINGQIKFCQIY